MGLDEARGTAVAPAPDQAHASDQVHAPDQAHAPVPYPPPAAWSAAPRTPRTRLGRALSRLWTQPAWLAPLALLGCAGMAFGYVAANDPTDTVRDPVGPCLFRTLTGLDCPGCGGTRMVWYLLHGNLPEAARHHLMALLLVPFVVYGFLAFTASRLFGTRPWRPGKKFWIPVAVAWIVFAVLRNLPFEPFLSFRV